MIKLILEIEEKGTKKMGMVTGSLIDVEVEEIDLKPTNHEKECADLIKEKIGIKDKFKVINKCKNIEELLNNLFSI